jgi:prolyl-tRNA synthetase
VSSEQARSADRRHDHAPVLEQVAPDLGGDQRLQGARDVVAPRKDVARRGRRKLAGTDRHAPFRGPTGAAPWRRALDHGAMATTATRIARMSTLFVRTLRDDPADTEVPSHRLLTRAGYIRRAAPGIYTWLPLGLRVLRRIEAIVREEMEAMGAQEVVFPALLPREPYEATGRWTEYGDAVFRLRDRRGADHLLGPTHEEMFTLLVKDLCSSYKDLPLVLFQIQTKYRDEARPRAGLLRGREFTMKDSYSFDVDDAGLDASYERHRETYVRIFDRLGFDYVIVAATSGAMGGSKSEEFLATADVGEDTYVRCTGCGYAANVEAVETPRPPEVPYGDVPAAHAEQTPDTPTIATLVDHLDEHFPREDRPWAAADTLKNVLVTLTHPDGTRAPLAIGLPGDREVDLQRLGGQLEPIGVAAMTDEEMQDHPDLVKGYIGPGVLGTAGTSGILYLVDPRVVTGTCWVTGANVDGSHVIDLVAGRDFTPDGTIEASEVRDGDACPRCDGGTLVSARGIEMGHIFQLGRKYAEALGLQVLDQHGKLVTVTMGSYGIGPSRAVAAIAENTLDDLGLCWPRHVAPYDVHLIAAGKDPALAAGAETLADDLAARDVEVLYDDRPTVSAGVKFRDAELIGVPTIVTVGRGLADGTIEVRDRATGDRTDVAVEEAADHIAALVDA